MFHELLALICSLSGLYLAICDGAGIGGNGDLMDGGMGGVGFGDAATADANVSRKVAVPLSPAINGKDGVEGVEGVDGVAAS